MVGVYNSEFDTEVRDNGQIGDGTFAQGCQVHIINGDTE